MKRLVEDGLTIGLAAAFLHVGQVRLVRRVVVRGRRVGLVLAGRQTTAWAVPDLGNGQTGLLGKTGRCLVTVAAPVRDVDARGGIATLGLTHRASADSATPDRVATCHDVAPWSSRQPGQAGRGWASCRTARSAEVRRWRRPRPGPVQR